MDFISGALLWGVVAAGLPVLIHLTGRAKPVVHRFPALRFILQSQRSSSRALRIKHVLLLALRMLAIALLAFALARPRFPFAAAGPGDLSRIDGAFVLVLDASMSMGALEQDTARLEDAREQALQLLEHLSPSARVALIRATDTADTLQARLTLNHDLVRQQLKDLQPSGRGLDLGEALRTAESIFEHESPDGRTARGIFLFTDLQRNAYAEVIPRAVSGPDETQTNKPALYLVDVGGRANANGAVLDVRIPGPTVAAHTPVTLTARVRPVDPQRVMPVELFVDGLRVAQRAVDPKGAATVEVEFTFNSGAPGPHGGEVVLAQSDALTMDQARALAYVAGRPPKALMIEDPPTQTEARGSAFFLRAALATEAAQSASGLSTEVLSSRELHAGKLADGQIVVLADPGFLSDPSMWKALADFVNDGGGLFVWAGARTDLRMLRSQGYSDFARHHGLLPGRIEDRLHAKKPLGVRVAQPDHPLLARCPPGVLSVLRGLQVRSYLKVASEIKDTQATVVLELENGAPLLLEKTYGRGRVLLCTIGPDDRQSDLPKRGEVFVTLALEGTRLLTGHGEQTAVKLGRPVTLTLPHPPADGVASWLRPDEERAQSLSLEPYPTRKSDEPQDPPALGRLPIPPLERPGIHAISWTPPKRTRDPRGDGSAPGEDAPRRILLAAHAETAESDLTRATHEECATALAAWEPVIVARVEDAPLLRGAYHGRELPVPLLLMVLAIVCVESFLSNRLYRSVQEEAE